MVRFWMCVLAELGLEAWYRSPIDLSTRSCRTVKDKSMAAGERVQVGKPTRRPRNRCTDSIGTGVRKPPEPSLERVDGATLIHIDGLGTRREWAQDVFAGSGLARWSGDRAASMNSQWVSLLGAVVSGGFAIAAVVVNRRAAVRDRRASAEEMAMRYRIPLLRAAFDLQTRLYNIGQQDFLGRFAGGEESPPEHREYAISNTLYLVAQYLCFSEIIRHGMLFLDPVDRTRQRDLMNAMEAVRDSFSDTMKFDDAALCLFRGEQRAIGEIMLTERAGAAPGAPGWDCLGYAAFVTRLDECEFSRWFRLLRRSLDDLRTDLPAHDRRLVQLQHHLLDLIGLMDPDHEQVPHALRERLPAAAARVDGDHRDT